MENIFVAFRKNQFVCFLLSCSAILVSTMLLANNVLMASTTPKIASGNSHTIALKSDGTVWAWGYNYYGQLGDGTTNTTDPYGKTTPIQVSGINDVAAIAGGEGHSLAMKSDGTVWAWGRNSEGQLGDRTTTNSAAPVQVSGLNGITAIASGSLHSLALKSDGTVWAWGLNRGYGTLGDGTTENKTTPVQVTNLNSIVAIAGGYYHSLALKSDGTVWAWGNNEYGQLGDGTTTNRTTPVQVSGISNVTTISRGMYHSLAIKSDGTAWTWGWNIYGQLGDGTTTNRTTPVQVSAFAGANAIAGGWIHSLVLKSDGTTWTWGYNGSGELGDGTTTNRTTPVQVSNISNITNIASGEFHSSALKSDGTVWTWGRNGWGQLGDGTTTNKTTPIQVNDLNLYQSATPTPTPTPSDTTAPTGSLNINSSASYANSTTVTLNLSATDSVGVTGYYISETLSYPSASASGWTSVTSTTSYSANVSYSFSGGDGNKTVYVWYKDAAGNMSIAYAHTISLDTALPTVIISNPTSDSTHTVTSSTISLGGSASDSSSGISSVSWSNNRGGNGTATGTASWTVSGISLQSGDNVITVTAKDGANNSGTDTLQVTYSTTTSSTTTSTTTTSATTTSSTTTTSPTSTSSTTTTTSPTATTSTTTQPTTTSTTTTTTSTTTTTTSSTTTTTLPQSPTPTITPVHSPLPVPTLPPLPTPQPSPSPAQEGIVFGFVYDENDDPMRGVTVSITGGAVSDSVKTNEEGYYEFRDLEAGNYTLTYEKDGCQTQTQDVTLRSGETKEAGTMILELIIKGKITGYVLDIRGEPIESVKVKLKGVKSKVAKSAASDADGFFEFSDLDADTYIITVKKKGYKRTKQTITLEDGESKETEITMRKSTKRILVRPKT